MVVTTVVGALRSSVESAEAAVIASSNVFGDCFFTAVMISGCSPQINKYFCKSHGNFVLTVIFFNKWSKRTAYSRVPSLADCLMYNNSFHNASLKLGG